MKLLKRIADLLDPERRGISSRDPELARMFGGLDLGGQLVNPRTAENLSCVLACVSAISSALARLPQFEVLESFFLLFSTVLG